MPESTVSKSHWAIVGIFFLLAVNTLDWAHQFLVPLTAASLGFFAVWPLEKRLRRSGVPSVVTATAVTLTAFAAVIFALGILIVPLTALLADLPDMIRDVQGELGAGAGGAVENLREAAEAAENAINGDGPELEVEVQSQPTVLTTLMATAPAVAAQICLALILLFFLIASGPSLMNTIVMAGDDFGEKRHAVKTIAKFADRLGTYLGGISMINAGLGVTIGIAMWFWEMPSPLIFGFIAFLLNFVPILGAIAGAGLAGIVGYSETGELWLAMSVFATYMVLTSVEAQFVTPYLISGRLRLNPAIVFIAVAFFAWIWSVVGMVVAVPILVAAKILLDEYPATRGIGRLIGAGCSSDDVMCASQAAE
jgi:predicted PurR-regulated permease PerM